MATAINSSFQWHLVSNPTRRFVILSKVELSFFKTPGCACGLGVSVPCKRSNEGEFRNGKKESLVDSCHITVNGHRTHPISRILARPIQSPNKFQFTINFLSIFPARNVSLGRCRSINIRGEWKTHSTANSMKHNLKNFFQILTLLPSFSSSLRYQSTASERLKSIINYKALVSLSLLILIARSLLFIE